MTKNSKATEMIDRYVEEVGQNLPKRLRGDVKAEMRSSLEDSVEDRSRAAGPAPDEGQVVEMLLKELGPPEKMAASYLPPKYLIGPRLYPTFALVMKIVLVVAGVGYLIALGVAFSQTAGTPGDAVNVLLGMLPRFASSMFETLGTVVLVFAILERVLPTPKEPPQEWDPRTLKATEHPERIQPGSLLWKIGITLGLLILINVYPQWIGAFNIRDGQWGFVPLLAPAFDRYVPWLNLQWVLGLILNLILLRQGRQRPWTRWATLGLGVLNLFIIYSMIAGGPLLGLRPEWVALHGWTGTSLAHFEEVLLPLLNRVVQLALAVALIVQAVELGRDLFRMLRKEELGHG